VSISAWRTTSRTFPHDGERATREFILAVLDGAGSLTQCRSQWLRMSGVGENTAVSHDHRILCEALRLGICYDQINVVNSAMAEQIMRHIIQHEMATSRDAKHPDYTGLGMLLNGTIGEKGAAHTTRFRSWIAGQQRDQAQILKQGRLLRDERASEAAKKIKKQKGGKDGGGGKDAAGDP
jgi:hypothetical protein